MDKYIDNYKVLMENEIMWDCHVDSMRDYLILNGIKIEPGILHILTEKNVPEFGVFKVKKIELGMLGKGPTDVLENVLNNLQIDYEEKKFPADGDMSSFIEILQEGKIPLILYDDVVLHEEKIAKENLIYFRHFSSSMLIGYNKETQEGIFSRRDIESHEFKRFPYRVISSALYSNLMPISVKGRYYVLEKLSESKKIQIQKNLNNLAIKALKNSLNIYFDCKVVDQDKFEKTIDCYSEELFKTIGIEPGAYYAGPNAYKKMISYLDILIDNLKAPEAKIESANKLYLFKLSMICAELKVSPTFYFLDLHNGLKEIFKNSNLIKKEEAEKILNLTYDLAADSRNLVRIMRGYKKNIFRKVNYIEKLKKSIQDVESQNDYLYEELQKALSEQNTKVDIC